MSSDECEHDWQIAHIQLRRTGGEIEWTCSVCGALSFEPSWND